MGGNNGNHAYGLQAGRLRQQGGRRAPAKGN